MEKNISIYYDKEGDYLEVNFEQAVGFFKATEKDAVMEKVALDDGRVIGFSIIGISMLTPAKPISILLAA